MDKKPQLTFFCELCRKPIEGNSCKIHGIDFVTIQRIDAGSNPSDKKPSDTRNMSFSMPGDPDSADNSAARGIATPEQIEDQDEFLPAVPEEPEPGNQDLDLLNSKKDFDQEFVVRRGAPGVGDHHRGSGFSDDANPDIIDAEFSEYDPASEEEEIFPAQPVERKSPVRRMMVPLLAVLILLAGGALYRTFHKGITPEALLDQAEALYLQQEFSQALLLYRDFLKKFPKDPHAPEVKDKIQAIQFFLTGSEPDSGAGINKLQEMMRYANIAFNKGQLVSPPGDNALEYLHKILEVTPEYAPALAMMDSIARHYEAAAQAAVENKQWDRAINLYHVLLEIRPHDVQIMDKMQFALTQKGKAYQEQQ